MLSAFRIILRNFRAESLRVISHIFLITLFFCFIFATILTLRLSSILNGHVEKILAMEKKNSVTPEFIKNPLPSPTPPATPAPKLYLKPKPAGENPTWGVAKQVDTVTWTMQLAQDSNMATAQTIFLALNNYRSKKGSNALSWNDKLAEIAQNRAATFVKLGKLDDHAGFNSYFTGQGHMKDIGLTGVGENSSFGYHLEGVHLIEWVFAGDAPHNNNQLNPEWTNVGIGVDGSAVDIVFSKK